MAMLKARGALWVVGRNARLFDYFLLKDEEDPSLKLSTKGSVLYNHKGQYPPGLGNVRVGELPGEEDGEAMIQIAVCIKSPFEEFAIAQKLKELGIPTVYVRAIYMTGTAKIEPQLISGDMIHIRHSGSGRQSCLRKTITILPFGLL